MSRFDATMLTRAMAWVTGGPRSAAAPGPTAPPPGLALDLGADELAIELAAQLCRRFEGLYLRPYLCPAGVPTIGYGATFYEDGQRVSLRDAAITPERAEQLLLWHLRTVCLPEVRRLCPGVRDPYLLAALMDFVFNLGASRLAASTLRRCVNAGQWARIPVELRKWVMSKGQRLTGLVRRREAECELVRLASLVS